LITLNFHFFYFKDLFFCLLYTTFLIVLALLIHLSMNFVFVSYNLTFPKSIKPAILQPAFMSVALEAILSVPVRAAGTLPAR